MRNDNCFSLSISLHCTLWKSIESDSWREQLIGSQVFPNLMMRTGYERMNEL